MTTLLIIVGIIAVALILLGAVALCRAAAMGDEAMRRWEQDMALRERLPETDGEGWKIHHNTVVKNPRAGFLIYDPDQKREDKV